MCKIRDIFNARHNDVRPVIREGQVLHLIRPVHLANGPWGNTRSYYYECHMVSLEMDN